MGLSLVQMRALSGLTVWPLLFELSLTIVIPLIQLRLHLCTSGDHQTSLIPRDGSFRPSSPDIPNLGRSSDGINH
jgi:hypothetical protein